MDIFFDILGWIGMTLVLVAYALLSSKKIDNGNVYQVINFAAALLMAVALFPKNAWFSFALQVAWGIIAIIALTENTKERKR